MVVELHLDRGILLGEAEADSARLLDLLNGPGATIALERAFEGRGHAAALSAVGHVVVPKAEILLAVPYDAGGLLPLALRREWRPTARARVVVAAGPLTIRGTLHGPREAGDPLEAVQAGHERRAFLPLTEATVEHRDGWSLAHPVVLVRRDALSLAAETRATGREAAASTARQPSIDE